MSHRSSLSRLLLIGLLLASLGCRPVAPFYLHEDGDLSHYLDKATRTETPDLSQSPLEEVQNALEPLTLSNPKYTEIWELSLEECVSIALHNTKLIRGGQPARLQNGQLFAGTQEGQLLQLGSRSFATPYNPAIVESNPGFQNDGGTVDGGVANVRQGVEAALAAFDAQLSIVGNAPGGNGTFLTKTDRPQNIPPGLAFGLPQIQTYNGGLTSQITKQTAEGTTFTFRNNTQYDRGFTRPANFQPLISTWTTTLEAEFRHPLLRGRGSQINRMPVIISRIGTDIEILNVQGQLQDMLNNLEIRYWDLYLAYRNLETAKIGRDSALITWRVAYDNFAVGQKSEQPEKQAREQYFTFRAAVETALRELYNAENELRLLMGLTATDGRLIRPKDEPTLVRVQFDWCDILAESIARRPELISKRWEIKQREMELILARNKLLPQLDVGGVYRWVGLGDDLINADRNGLNFPAQGSTAFDELFEGNYQEFGLFGSFTMPIGFRRELAGVRHAQLRMAREKAALEDMELDVSVGLAKGVRNVDANYQLAQTNANRWSAAQREVEIVQDQYPELVTADLVLEAQRRRAQAQNAFWNSVVEYNKSIADLHTRKGSILEYNSIGFEEGPWPEKAYWDALQRARARDAGTYMDYGWTRPRVISQGPTGTEGGGFHTINVEGAPSEMVLETLPATEGTPTPAQRPALADPPAEADMPMELAPPAAPAAPLEPALGRAGRAPAAVAQASAVQPLAAPKPAAATTSSAALAQSKPRLKKVSVAPSPGSVQGVSYSEAPPQTLLR